MTVLPHRFAMHYTHREHNSDILYSMIKPVHSVQPLLLNTTTTTTTTCPVNVGAVLLPFATLLAGRITRKIVDLGAHRP